MRSSRRRYLSRLRSSSDNSLMRPCLQGVPRRAPLAARPIRDLRDPSDGELVVSLLGERSGETAIPPSDLLSDHYDHDIRPSWHGRAIPKLT